MKGGNSKDYANIRRIKWSVGVAILLTTLGAFLSSAAILTPSWQVVNLPEYNAVHEHGLWLDCIRHTYNRGTPIHRPFSFSHYFSYTIDPALHCVYKFDYDHYSSPGSTSRLFVAPPGVGEADAEDDNSPIGEVNRHKWYGWHVSTLVLLTLALITSLLSCCIGVCACRHHVVFVIGFMALTTLTAFLSSVAIGLYFLFSHRTDNRFIKGIVGTYEQRVGLAFYMQMAACFAHFIASLISLLATYFGFACNGSAVRLARQSPANSSRRTNISNVAADEMGEVSREPPPKTAYRSQTFIGQSSTEQCHISSTRLPLPLGVRWKWETRV